jgi:glycosyltransferase involved in cell wall biosynthesis
MVRRLKICSTLYRAEMEADYVQVLEGLARKGHEVHTFLHVPTTTWDPHIPSLRVFPTRELFKIDRLSVLNSLSLKATQHIRKHDIDVVYATGTRLGEGLVAGILTGRPVLCDVRNPWSIQWKDFRQSFALKTIVGHNIRRIRYSMEERLIHRADRIVAYSRGIKRWLVADRGLEEDKITVIPPHVDTAMFHPNLDPTRVRNKYGLGSSPVLMYVGVFNHSRGMDVLVEALQRTRSEMGDVKLMLIGPQHRSIAPYIRDLRERIHALGLDDDVLFTGYVPFQEVPEYITAADVCVVPHRRNFTYEISPPVKILEYMASQKPIVTTDVGIRDFIVPGETGLIVEPDDPLDLAEAINYLLKNPSFAREIARNARQFVVENLREEMMVDKFEESLESIAG